MIIAVGLVESRSAIQVELRGDFTDEAGVAYPSGPHELTSAIVLKPSMPASDSFVVRDVTIGVGFHWERSRTQGFRGALRVVEADGLTAINDVPLESYVRSVISSEMSPECPLELLKAHAVISRSWLVFPDPPCRRLRVLPPGTVDRTRRLRDCPLVRPGISRTV